MSQQTMPDTGKRPPEPRDQGQGPHDQEPTRQLVREAIDQAGELVRLEVALARNEIKTELARTKAGAVVLSSAGATAVASLTLFLVAIAFAFALKALAALLMALGLLFIAGALGVAGYKLLPRRPIAETTRRIESDLNRLKERIQ